MWMVIHKTNLADFHSRYFLSDCSILRADQFIVEYIEFMNLGSYFFVIFFSRLVGGMQSIDLWLILVILNEIFNRIRIYLFLYDVSQLHRSYIFRLYVQCPLNFIQSQFKLAIIKVHQSFQQMSFHVIFSIFDGFLDIQIPLVLLATDQIQTR